MNSVRIRNLKSIRDSGTIDIKPLTVLIGKNSSGKSTFLRTFPLIKQSIAKILSDPILWYGEDVDFGSFNNSISDYCNKERDNIILSFNIDLFKRRYIANRRVTPRNKEGSSVNISIFISQNRIDKYEFSFNENDKIVLIYDQGIRKYKISIKEGEFLKRELYVFNTTFSFFVVSAAQTEDAPYIQYGSIVPERIYKSLPNGASAVEKLIYYSVSEDFGTIFDSEKRQEKVRRVLVKYENELTKANLSLDEVVEEISDNLLHVSIIRLVNDIGEEFTAEFKKVQYFQPIRNRGDRFYRVQGLNVRSVDSDGINAPMILYLLGDERKKFEDWCETTFGFKYVADSFTDSGESASIYVQTTEDKQRHNMTDVGFGYSQIFPIVLSLWMNSKVSNDYRREQTIVIEQPELHLHPSFQKRVVSLMMKIIELSKGDIKFVIETHSETIINYIGKRIRDKGIPVDFVNLQVIDKENGYSVFKHMKFGSDGIIENWPLGFFSDGE